MNVLIIEDHEDTAHALSRVLREWGHESAVVGGAEEALRLCSSRRFDLILSDIVLGDTTGWDVARQLKTQCGAKLIAITGLGQPEDVERSMAAGFDAHLVKPVAMEKLRETIERVTAAKPPGPALTRTTPASA